MRDEEEDSDVQEESERRRVRGDRTGNETMIDALVT